jgi:hypothetical protein
MTAAFRRGAARHFRVPSHSRQDLVGRFPVYRVSSLRSPITRAASLNLRSALAVCCRPQEVKKTLRGPAECLMP